jgi:hypothetical protein
MAENDVTLQVGIDLELLKTETGKVGDELQKMLKPFTATGATGSKGPADTFVASFEKLKLTVDTMYRSFSSITKELEAQNKLWEKQLGLSKETHKLEGGAVGGGVGGDTGGAAGGGSGGGGGGRMPYGLGNLMGRAGTLGMITAVGNMIVHGATQYADAAFRNASANPFQWTGADAMSAAAGAVGAIPVVGGMLSTGFSYGAKEMAKEERTRDQRYELWRDAGEETARGYRTRWSSEGGREVMLKHGIGQEEDAQIQRGVGRATGSSQAPTGVYAMQSMMGAGQEATGLLGAMRRGGIGTKALEGDRNQMEIFGQVLGVAMASGLERSRWGEQVVATQKAVAQTAIGATVDMQRVTSMLTFIGGMGARYQGDTAASQRMQQIMGGLSQGTLGGVADVFSLQAAMQGGATYEEAVFKQQLGVTGDDGNDPQKVLQPFMNMPEVQLAMASGDDKDIKRAGARLNMLQPNISGPEWADIIRRRRQYQRVGGFAGAAIELGARLTGAKMSGWLSRGPDQDVNMDPRRKAIRDTLPATRVVAIQGDVAEPGAGKPAQRDWTQTSMDDDDNLGQVFGGGGFGARGGAAPEGVQDKSWSKMGEGIRSGPTTAQRLAFKGAGKNAPQDFEGRFVSSMAEAETQWASKIGHGLYAQRDLDAQGRPIPGGEKRIHGGRDIFMPPDSTVYTPVDGTWVRKGAVQAGDPRKGSFGELKGKDGTLYRFLHLGWVNPKLVPGRPYAAGTLVGRTVAKPTGDNPSHLHLEAWSGGKKVDPFDHLSSENVNMMYTGFRSLESYQHAGRASTTASAAPEAAVAPSGTKAAVGAVAAVPAAPGAPQQVQVAVAVEDHRISVTKKAGARKQHGQPGQIFKAPH